MKILIQTKYTQIAARAGHYYHRSIQYLGVPDSDATRVFSAIGFSVALYYVCAAIQTAIDILTDAAPVLTALLTQ